MNIPDPIDFDYQQTPQVKCQSKKPKSIEFRIFNPVLRSSLKELLLSLILGLQLRIEKTKLSPAAKPSEKLLLDFLMTT